MKGGKTSKQLADIEEKRASLLNRIQRWRQVQLIYMPGVGALLAQALTAASDSQLRELAESIPLHLPSSLPRGLRTPDISAITEKECRLRVAQADDALADIRRQRRIISGLWQFKKLNVDGTGNKPQTRMRTLYARFNIRTLRFTARYRAARGALLVLDPDGDWKQRLQHLKDGDIRGPGKVDDGTSNGRYILSWIWLVPRVSSAPDMGESEMVLDESMRVEWAKSQARRDRWEEEFLIVQEEMRRFIKYEEWRGQWWHDQAHLRSGLVRDDTFHGIVAYAEKQAHICGQLAQRCVTHWLPILQSKGIMPEWASRYITSGVITIAQSSSASTNSYSNNGGDMVVPDEDGEEVDDEDIDSACDEEGIDIDTFELDE
jgi:hypothetical protein